MKLYAPTEAVQWSFIHVKHYQMIFIHEAYFSSSILIALSCYLFSSSDVMPRLVLLKPHIETELKQSQGSVEPEGRETH
jgi:hypothetical protein